MFYPYYEDPDKFTPNSESIQSWLKTRKNRSSNKPGIFETTEYKKDQLWSWASILIELSALYFTLQGAFRTYKQTGNIWIVWIALIAVLLFIAFDIIGIMLHGHDKPHRTIDRAMYLVHPDPAEKVKIYDRLKETTMREFFGILLLSISAALKIGALWYFLVMSNIQLLIVFTIFYIIVIYIHSAHTVYWWPALNLKISIRKQHKKWKEYYSKGLITPSENTIDSTNVISYPFHSNTTLNHTIQTCVEGRIKVIQEKSGEFILQVAGPLWDENIVHLCTQWGEKNLDDLIHSCIKVQLMQCNQIVPNS
jgi:hypothetical protein